MKRRPRGGRRTRAAEAGTKLALPTIGAALLVLVAGMLLTGTDAWWSAVGWVCVIWGLSGLAFGLAMLIGGEPPRLSR